MRSPSTTIRGTDAADGASATRSARTVGPWRSEARHAAMVAARPAALSEDGPRPTMTALPHAPTPELPDDRRDARPRPPRHRHDPDALDRWRPAGELGAPGRPDGRRADGLRPLDALPPPRADPPGLAGPRPLRPQRRPRQHAAVLAAPPHRLRPRARRPQAVPPVGQPDPRPPRIRPDAGRRGDHRAAGPGAGERDRDGHRRAPPRGRVQPRRPRHRRPLDLRDRLGRRPPGGDRVGGVQPRGASAARQAGRPLRRQPHPARRPDLDGVVGGRRSSASRPTAGTPAGSRTATTSRRSRRPSRPPAATTGRA